MNWIFEALPLEAYWVGVARGVIALLSLLVLIVLQKVSASGYPNPAGRFAARAVRIGVALLSLFYWLLILGQVPLIGATSARLTPILLLGYTAQALMVIAVGVWARESPYRKDKH